MEFSSISGIFLLLTLLTWECLGQLPNGGIDSEWTHELVLSKRVSLKWNSSDPEYLLMEMSAPTKGYVAVGFSPNGGMPGSDIAMGWVDSSGLPRIVDMYAEGYRAPKVDPVQNYELISGREENGQTTIRFRRKWTVCNEYARNIGNDTVRLIWAMHEEDPVPDPVLGFKGTYHGENRGVRRVYIRSKASHVPFPDQLTPPDPSIKQWDVRMENNVVDKEDDVYFCQISKFPKMDKKHHLIGYRPLLQEGNEFSIHHIIMYECIVPSHEGNKTENIFEQYADKPGGKCWTPNMPPEWGQYCSSIPILWTAGSEGNMFPANTGNPLGEGHGGATYFMFEVHYDNPQLRSFVDSSGFRLFYTDNLRQYDSAAILVGKKVSPFHVVPPKQESFTSFGYCTSECTSQTIPVEGITVTTVLLHAHTAGKRIVLRHLRNGKELEPVAEENHYDFNYQQVRVIDPPLKVLPGDELITECEYNTTGKDKPAFGGLGTRDEMCMSFIYYYPKIDLAECKTQQEFNSFINSLGVQKVDGDILKELKMPYVPKEGQVYDYGDNPFYLKNNTYDTYLNALDVLNIVEPLNSKSGSVGHLIRTMDWEKEGTSVESKWNGGDHYAFCTGGVKKRYPLTNYIVKLPTYEKYVGVKDEKCEGESGIANLENSGPAISVPVNPGNGGPLAPENVNVRRVQTQFDLRQGPVLRHSDPRLHYPQPQYQQQHQPQEYRPVWYPQSHHGNQHFPPVQHVPYGYNLSPIWAPYQASGF